MNAFCETKAFRHAPVVRKTSTLHTLQHSKLADCTHSDFHPSRHPHLKGESPYWTYDVGPKAESVRRGLEMEDLRDFKDLTRHDVTHQKLNNLHFAHLRLENARFDTTLSSVPRKCQLRHASIVRKTPTLHTCQNSHLSHQEDKPALCRIHVFVRSWCIENSACRG